MIQIKMLKNAMKNNYIVPAFNFANFEILKGLLQAIEETKSPAILQVSEGAMKYLTDDLLEGLILGLRKKKLPISIHLDHGSSLEVIKKAIKLGFDSVMIDGSTLPYKENVKLTQKVVKYAHMHNVSVEGELGVLAIANDEGVLADEVRFTDPLQAREFVELTGVDCLAISIGTNHGVNKYTGEAKIRYDILKKIEKEIPSMPLVLHGASLVEKSYVENINNFGGKIEKSIGNEKLLSTAYKTHICKINMDTDFRLAYTSAIREYMTNCPEQFDPRKFGAKGVEEVKKCAIKRIVKICKSNDRV